VKINGGLRRFGAYQFYQKNIQSANIIVNSTESSEIEDLKNKLFIELSYCTGISNFK
jgi:hypothetical protein